MEFADQAELDAFLVNHPDIEVIELVMPDLSGIARCKRIQRSEFRRLFSGDFLSPQAAPLLGILGDFYDNTPLPELNGDPDQLLRPISGTLAPVPWYTSPVAQVMVAYVTDSGRPDWVDTRLPLVSVLEQLEADGLKPTVATELEFYLLAPSDGERPEPLRGAIPGTNQTQEGIQYCMPDDLFDCDAFLNDVRLACELQQVPMTAIHSEFSPGQWEINTHHQSDPVLAGHHALLLRRIVKGCARRHGLGATFMAKPFASIPGNGMHIHASLYDLNGNNVCADPDPVEPPRMMPALRHGVAGLANLLDESMLCFAPNPNSYRRVQAAALAPSGRNWGYDHRDVALRIPRAPEQSRRIEHRVAGADANPYLVLAAVLAGIHWGLKQQADPGAPIPRDTDISENETTLPTRVDEAIRLFAKGTVLPDYFGEKFCRVYTAVRRGESDDYHSRIPDLDYGWYLRAL